MQRTNFWLPKGKVKVKTNSLSHVRLFVKQYSRSNFLKQTKLFFFLSISYLVQRKMHGNQLLLPVVPCVVFCIQFLALRWKWVGGWVTRMQRKEDTNHIALSLQTRPVSSLIGILCDDLSILYLILPVLTLPSGRDNIYFPLQAVV